MVDAVRVGNQTTEALVDGKSVLVANQTLEVLRDPIELPPAVRVTNATTEGLFAVTVPFMSVANQYVEILGIFTSPPLSTRRGRVNANYRAA